MGTVITDPRVVRIAFIDPVIVLTVLKKSHL